MKAFFQFDSDEERESLLARARNVALWAIQQYDIEWNRITFIQLSYTITYKIETGTTTGSYLLRIHSERVNKEEILSELILLAELQKSDSLVVPEGIASRDGSYVLEAVTDQGYRSPYISMMRWVEGEHLREFKDHHVCSMGAMMGKLHAAAVDVDVTPTFVRPHWRASSFEQEITKLERYYSRFLSGSSWELYQKAIDNIIQQMGSMKPNDQNYGLIHADLHSGNIVFHKDEPCPIDFGRAGYGYYLYDMAGALLELNPAQRKLFIDGYESIRKLDPNYEKDLECFLLCL